MSDPGPHSTPIRRRRRLGRLLGLLAVLSALVIVFQLSKRRPLARRPEPVFVPEPDPRIGLHRRIQTASPGRSSSSFEDNWSSGRTRRSIVLPWSFGARRVSSLRVRFLDEQGVGLRFLDHGDSGWFDEKAGLRIDPDAAPDGKSPRWTRFGGVATLIR